MGVMRNLGLNEETLAFQQRIFETSGIGDKTAWPNWARESLETGKPPAKKPCIEDSRREAEDILFPLVEKLLEKTKTRAAEVDFLVVNCSLFCPTPSLCAMLANKFGFREDLVSYNLGGMGCSAGVIAIDLGKRLLEGSTKNGLA